MNIGVLCPSEIAYRRFMPALNQLKNFKFIGIAVNSPKERYSDNLPKKEIVEEMLRSENEKAEKFINDYGGKKFNSYEELISSDQIDAVYIPLPPGLHYYWAKKALEYGKHVLVEKPSTISYEDTFSLIELAKKKKLVIHENYMFQYHSQIDTIDKLIKENRIGDIRLFRIYFGFPMRQRNDFRYNKSLGGGALFDAGGYTLKYATHLLGNDIKIKQASLNYLDNFDVDMYGFGTLINKLGVTAQVAFGMDNDYKCELEVWGSKGTIFTDRILTAPVGFNPTFIIKENNNIEKIILDSDDTFKKSIQKFNECINEDNKRIENYEEIMLQAKLVDDFRKLAREEL